jgi:perosamine synthetase
MFGVKHVVATTSGTTALLIAMQLMTLELKSQRVFCPAYGFIAGAEMAKWMNFDIKLVDVDETSMAMDFNHSQERHTVNRGDLAIVIEHNGRWSTTASETMQKLTEGVRTVPTVLDMACSIASKLGPCPRPGASFYTWSFSVPKFVTTGQGGAIGTNDAGLHRLILDFVDHGGGWRNSRLHSKLGFNFRFNDILAAYGLAQLERIDEIIQKQHDIWGAYDEYLCMGRSSGTAFGNGWCYSYKSQDPIYLIDCLDAQGIQASRLYPPLRSHSSLELFGSVAPIADKLWESIVYLPSWIGMSRKEVQRVARAVIGIESHVSNVRRENPPC